MSNNNGNNGHNGKSLQSSSDSLSTSSHEDPENTHRINLGPFAPCGSPKTLLVPRGTALEDIDVDSILDRRSDESDDESDAHLLLDMRTLQTLVRANNEKKKDSDKFWLEYKKRSPDNFEEEDVEEIKRHFRIVRAERESEKRESEKREKERIKQAQRITKSRGNEGASLNSHRPTAPTPNPPGRSNHIPTVSLTVPPGEFGWVVVENQWLSSANIETYTQPTEWKVTELVGLHDSKLAILGRNGNGKTIIEIYHVIDTFVKLYEKIFDHQQKDSWQFGAETSKIQMVLGCQHELYQLDMKDMNKILCLPQVDIRKAVISWGSKRVRALGSNSEKIIVANDRDLSIQVFDMDLHALHSVTLQERFDCIWSLAVVYDKIFVCCGISGDAFAVDWEGKTLFNVRPPETTCIVIPAVVVQDCDGFVHIFWLVKSEETFRAVDFYYNVREDKYLAEVRFDRKVKYMSSIKRPPPDPSVLTRNGRTAVMTDDGELFISETIFERSRENCDPDINDPLDDMSYTDRTL